MKYYVVVGNDVITGEVHPKPQTRNKIWMFRKCNHINYLYLTRTTDPWINVPLRGHGTHM